jgi:hypothetical protein
MSNVLSPIVQDLFGRLVELEDGGSRFERLTATRLFDRFVSVSWLRRMDEQLGGIRQSVRARHPAEREAVLLNVVVLGRDSLVGSLGVSLATILRSQAGRPLEQMSFPVMLPETGVPMAERIAVDDFDLCGVSIRQGEWVRLYLQSFSYSKDAAQQMLIFGVGAHSCLGRQITLDVWTQITKWLALLPRRVEIAPFEYCASNIFAIPDKIEATLT